MFNSRIRGRAALVVTTALLVFAAPQAARADGTPSGPSAAELATSGLLTRTGGDLADAVEAIGTQMFPSIYGGMIEVNNGRVFDIYLTKLDPAAEAAFQAVAPDGTLQFVKARRSAAQLDAVHQKFMDAVDGLRARGIVLTSFWPDMTTGTEHVGVLNLSAASSAQVAGIAAASDVTMFTATTADIPHTATTRQNDTSPFNGGDAIVNLSYGGCTSGFGIRVSGTTFLLTAGHCFPLNTAVHNAQCTSIPCTTITGSNITMGSVNHRASVANQLDTEYINARGSRLVFSGSRTASTTVIVAGTTTSPVGAQICTSGSYSGEHCGAVIDNANSCQSFFVDIDDQVETYCHLVHATLASHGILTEGGDSGGPVFRFSGSNALAVGTITGQTTTSDHLVTCTYLPNNTCSWDQYYTNISNILSLWGATIVTT